MNGINNSSQHGRIDSNHQNQSEGMGRNHRVNYDKPRSINNVLGEYFDKKLAQHSLDSHIDTDFKSQSESENENTDDYLLSRSEVRRNMERSRMELERQEAELVTSYDSESESESEVEYGTEL